MNNKISLSIITLCITTSLFSQQPIDVTDQTIKIGGTKSEEIYLGFAAGDKIIFSFREINGKELKEIEIIEYPDNSKYSDFKTSKIENKTLSVSKQSVYIFRFKNSALAGRICRIHIQRIPASDETINFNTSVSWITKQDTVWRTYTKDVVIGYDTVYVQKTKKELVKTEQKEELLFDKPQRVHSVTNSNGNKTSLFFTLPQNTSTPDKTTKVIAWAYWVGVGKEGTTAWASNTEAVKKLAVKTAAYFTSPLGALAVGVIAELMTPKQGEDVYYAVTDDQNRNFFLSGYQYRVYDEGKGVAGYRKFNDQALCQGSYFICLSNDNTFQGIDATVKVIAIIETKEYKDRIDTDMEINPRYEKQLYKEPEIKTSKIPVTGF